MSPGPCLLQGNEACAEGAIAAGCRFFAGYPITPSSEIMTRMVRRLAEVGGKFVQMEDEIGSIAAVIGASWAGAKAMTATSGPGLTLMMENISYAIMTETPCVVVDVQRAGPSTGQATRPAQGDFMQSRWGTHGGFPTIVLAPASVQEMFDLTVRAFNLAEGYRVPVILLADEVVGHLRERCNVPEEVEVWNRYREPGAPPFDTDHPSGVPPMPKFGDGEKLLITGSTHDGSGLRRAFDGPAQDRLAKRLVGKIEDHLKEISSVERYRVEDADTILVSFGFSARAARRAVDLLRNRGVAAGLLRLQTVWPFPDEAVAEACQGRRVVVVEMNAGQLAREVARAAGGYALRAVTRQDGEPMTPGEILSAFGEFA